MNSVIAPYDLHLHSHWSYDAVTPPEAYFRQAREKGIACIAITDHHVLDGTAEFAESAQRYPDVRWIVGGEFTVTTSLGSVDLLCYGLPRTPSVELQHVLDYYHEWQRAAGEARSQGLMALGIPFTPEERLALLKSYRPEKAIALQGSTHVKNGVFRQYLADRGHIPSLDQYAELMDRAQGKAPIPPYPSVTEVAPALKNAGGLIAIAHPKGYFAGCDEARMDALRSECRLDGIECAHRSVPAELTPRYRDYCRRHGLFSVGGSDAHSEAESQEWLGRHGGEADWLDEFLERVG